MKGFNLEVKPTVVSVEQKPNSDLTKDTSHASDRETPAFNKPPQKIQSIARMPVPLMVATIATDRFT